MKQRQRNKKPMNQELENHLLTWFFEKRTIGAHVTDALLLEKAVQLKEEFGASSQFKASRGWLSKFKQRNNIRLVRAYDKEASANNNGEKPSVNDNDKKTNADDNEEKPSSDDNGEKANADDSEETLSADDNGEKATADDNGARQFLTEFYNFMEEEEINPENIYNMAETGLLWKALPVRTLVSKTEKSVNGHTMKKDRLTLGLCANSTGTHKLMPLLIYKCKQPKALRNSMDQLPVVFQAQANALIDQTLFTDWFDNYFKKSVQQRQSETGLCGKVILLLDNSARHKFLPNYVQDENFIIKYLPPSTTSLIKPMDQGIIETFKRSFRHKMAWRLLHNEGDVNNFDKQYTLQHCINMIDKAWGEITSNDIRKAWGKIITKTKNRAEYEEEEKGENVVLEMQQILTRISGHDTTCEEIEEYFKSCRMEEDRSLETIEGTVESRSEEMVKKKESYEEWDEERDKDWDGERDKDWDEEVNEERDEERNEVDQTLQRGIPLSTEEREKLEDIFKYLESFKNRILPSSQFHIEGLKITFLGLNEFNQNIR
ncbi:tigger transposable element-derived protein 2-like isoform X2 [Hylaeus anthracinus]|nr:tigger transposable element-derived protein 2-like isoform X2 [Hylaeus anthracinus]